MVQWCTAEPQLWGGWNMHAILQVEDPIMVKGLSNKETPLGMLSIFSILPLLAELARSIPHRKTYDAGVEKKFLPTSVALMGPE